MSDYKTTEGVRARALARYYAKRDEIRIYQEQYRRAQGIAPRKPKMTEDERLAVVRYCRVCGQRVTARSLLLSCQNLCGSCMGKAARKSESPVKRRARQNRYARQQRAARTQMVQEMKVARGCQMCGYAGDARRLDFHHRDPSTKKFKIARGTTSLVSMADLLAEVQKCDVLCKTCHERVHQETPSSSS